MWGKRKDARDDIAEKENLGATARAAGGEGAQSLEKTRTGCFPQKGKGGNMGNRELCNSCTAKTSNSELEGESQYYCSDEQHRGVH